MLSNSLSRRIEWGDCDPAGIVFNPRYFAFFDHATNLLYEAAGWPKQEMIERFNIVGCALVETKAIFSLPCRFGDVVTITSTVVEVRRSSFDIRHELRNAEGMLCIQGLETRVWTARDPESGTIKSSPIPDEVTARLCGSVEPDYG